MAEIFIPKWKAGNGSTFMKNLEKHLKYHVDLERYEERKRAIEANIEARTMGSAKTEGLGQLKLVVPAREWHRWNNEFPGCWSDEQFVRELFRDNPHFRGQGVAA